MLPLSRQQGGSSKDDLCYEYFSQFWHLGRQGWEGGLVASQLPQIGSWQLTVYGTPDQETLKIGVKGNGVTIWGYLGASSLISTWR